MNRDKEYWIKRFEYLEKAQIENEDKYVSTLLEEYDKAKSNIEKEISSWLSRFSINNQISLKDVNKWLNSEELIAKRVGKCKCKSSYMKIRSTKIANTTTNRSIII